MNFPVWQLAAIVAAVMTASNAGAQDLASRIRASDGAVNVVYPSRPTICGDGRTFIRNVLGEGQYFTADGSWHDSAQEGRCVRGPARVLATVVSGEVTRLRLSVGPVPNAPGDVPTIAVSATEAADWLGALATRGSSRAAADAILPLVVADASDPWPVLLRIARDDDRPRAVRSVALLWLSSAVSDHLGIASADAHATDDDQVREQAVFAITQRPKSESVPELIEIARMAKNAAARRAAIFWLGQTGDRRAADVFAELLGVR